MSHSIIIVVPSMCTHSIIAAKDGDAGKTQDNGAAIDPIAEAHKVFFPHQKAPYAQNLIHAAEIPEFRGMDTISSRFRRLAFGLS
jgi:hypothetical protein